MLFFIEITVGAIENKKFDAILDYIAPKGVDENGAIQFEIKGLEYLIESNKVGLGDKPSLNSHLSAKNKKVIVIGGGDTAMDCVRTSIRQNAKELNVFTEEIKKICLDQLER